MSSGAYTAINTAYVTTDGTNGPFDDATIAVTVAHELAHNLGAKHDDLFDESTGCHRDADDERYVMWPSIENTDEISFSNCSAETVHKLVHSRRYGNFAFSLDRFSRVPIPKLYTARPTHAV